MMTRHDDRSIPRPSRRLRYSEDPGRAPLGLRAGRIALAGSVVIGLAGCAIVPRDAGFADVRSAVAQRTGLDPQWRGRTTDDAAADRAVRDLLAQPLTAETAVAVALLNNPSLQATYQDLGIAQADVVQAGLLANPTLSAERRFSGQAAEVDLFADFFQLLLLPLRKQLADTAFAAVKARVGGAVLDTAADVRVAFYTYQGDVQALEMRRTVLAAAEAQADAARRLFAAGNTNELTLDTHLQLVTDARLELANAEAQAAVDRERCNVLMGLWGDATNWSAAERLPELPPADPPAAGLESLAVRQRLDLGAGKADVTSAARSLGFVDATRFVTDATIGFHYEHEPYGIHSLGPSVQVGVPIFDQGQARVASGQDQLRQAQFRLAASAVRARSDVRAASVKLQNARGRATYYQRSVLPLQARIVSQTQLQYNGMFVGVFGLLQARQNQIDAGRAYIDAVRDYWVARAELERAIGGRLPGTTPPPHTRPTTAPALPVPSMKPDMHMGDMHMHDMHRPADAGGEHHHGS